MRVRRSTLERLTAIDTDLTVEPPTHALMGELARAGVRTQEWRYSPDQPRDDAGRFGESGGTDAEKLAAGHSPSQALAIDVAQRELALLDHERVIVLDKDGKRLYQNDGEAKAVEFDAVGLAPKIGTGTTLLHNHPKSNNSFSTGDLAIAAYVQAAETRVRSQAWTYVMRPGAQGWPSFVRLASSSDRESKVWSDRISDADTKSQRAKDAFNEKAWHAISAAVAKEYGLTYMRVAN